MAAERNTRLSLVVTTFNNAATLARCLESAGCADDIVVLDSGSDDETPDIARRHGARFFKQPFAGYGPQKQRAIDLALHDRVLLLDADEALTPATDRAIAKLKASGFEADGYELPRVEQVFWRMQSRWTRANHFLRLFDRRLTRMSDMPIHAAPQCDGRVRRLNAAFLHFGEPDIRTKTAKLNHWSSDLADHRWRAGRRASPWMMVLYPPFFFLRLYLFKRQFTNGWAGFINAAAGAHYAFLKYAKLYERRRKAGNERKEQR